MFCIGMYAYNLYLSIKVVFIVREMIKLIYHGFSIAEMW